MDRLKEQLPQLYSDSYTWIKKFSKNTYEAAFLEFQEKYKELLTEIEVFLSETDEEKGVDKLQELSKIFTATALDYIGQATGKKEKETKQIDLNMAMAVFIIPAIRYNRQAEAVAFTEKLCEDWSIIFKSGRIQSADYTTIEQGFHKKMCYITTAVCESMNKPADCYELTLLKQYRDGSMSETEEGRKLVEKYYDIAPTIVKRINKEKASQQIYNEIWEKYLRPCISYIETGKNEECKELYVEMVEKLHREYMEEYYA